MDTNITNLFISFQFDRIRLLLGSFILYNLELGYEYNHIDMSVLDNITFKSAYGSDRLYIGFRLLPAFEISTYTSFVDGDVCVVLI